MRSTKGSPPCKNSHTAGSVFLVVSASIKKVAGLAYPPLERTAPFKPKGLGLVGPSIVVGSAASIAPVDHLVRQADGTDLDRAHGPGGRPLLPKGGFRASGTGVRHLASLWRRGGALDTVAEVLNEIMLVYYNE